MSDSDEEEEETTSEEEEDEEETTSDEDDDDDDDDDSDDDDDDDDPHSSDEPIELIQVGDVRTAFSMATGGKNCCSIDQFSAVLESLNIKLNEKRTQGFFTMLDEDATDEVGWNAMFYALRDGQSKFQGLPMDQVVGGLLVEFGASARGRKRQQAVIKKSMISFLHKSGIKMEEEKVKEKKEIEPAGLDKPTRNPHHLHTQPSGSVELSIPEHEEKDVFDTDLAKASSPFITSPHGVSIDIGGVETPVSPKRKSLSKGKSDGSSNKSTKLSSMSRKSHKPRLKYERCNLDKLKLKGPMGEVLEDALMNQDESLYMLYEKISILEEEIARKYSHEDVVNGMNNVLTLQNAIQGIAKSSVETLKQDMSQVLNKSAVHSAHQVAKEISSQLTRMNHTINTTNKILSTQAGRDFEDKLENLEEFLQHIDMNRSQMMAPNTSRPGSAYFGKRGNSAKAGMSKGATKSIQFTFDAKSMANLGLGAMNKDDIEPIVEGIEVIKNGVTSMEDSLQENISERLLKLEKTVFALFGQLASNKKTNAKLLPVEELVLQLDMQKANFEADIRKVKLKNEELEKLLQHTKDTASREKQAAVDERERLLIALGRFLQQEAVVNELRGELKKKLGIQLRSTTAEETPNKETKETNEEEKEKAKADPSAVDLVSAQKHIHLNNYEPDSKYNKQTQKYEKKLLEHNTAMQMKALKSILEYKSIDDIPNMDDDEIPDFLRMDKEIEEDDAQHREDSDTVLEAKLGFGYEELLRVYRANTDLNLRLSFAKWERDELIQRLEEVKQPVILNTVGRASEMALQLKYESLLDQINSAKLDLVAVRGQKKMIHLIDKYRLEMYRDVKKGEWEGWRDLREEKLEMMRQKRMIKMLFEQTKLRAHKIMDEVNDLRATVKDEIELYSVRKHEMLLTKAKYADKMSKNKVEMEEELVNREVANHIEIYKQHLEDEAERKAEEDMQEQLDEERCDVKKEWEQRFTELLEDMQPERIEHEKEIKRLKHEIVETQKALETKNDLLNETQRRYKALRAGKAGQAGQLTQIQDMYKALQEEFKQYKVDAEKRIAESVAQKGNGGLHQQFSQPQGPVDPKALWAGSLKPSQELELARKEYKKFKMASDQKDEQMKKLLREKRALAEDVGRLNQLLATERKNNQERQADLVAFRTSMDDQIGEKLRPFVHLIESVGRDVMHNAPTDYIWNHKKKEFAEMEEELAEDQSDWYVHKNHVLRCFFFSIEEWFRDYFWMHERIVQCNASVHEAMKQVLMDTWTETRIQTHAFIRFFGDLDYREEIQLFYTVKFDEEERYFWNKDMWDYVEDYRSGVIDSYYKECVAEREERREGYWKRHPDVYKLYKQRYIETTKRYRMKMQNKKDTLEYMKKQNIKTLKEADFSKTTPEFPYKSKSKTKATKPAMKRASSKRKSQIGKVGTPVGSGSRRKRKSKANIPNAETLAQWDKEDVEYAKDLKALEETERAKVKRTPWYG